MLMINVDEVTTVLVTRPRWPKINLNVYKEIPKSLVPPDKLMSRLLLQRKLKTVLEALE
jgi:hypothetical protein